MGMAVYVYYVVSTCLGAAKRKYTIPLSARFLSLSFASPVDDNPESFLHEHAGVTFVGRPFPLDEAHEHLARLRRWGLTFSKLLQLQHLTN
jgi:hypothetical protein